MIARLAGKLQGFVSARAASTAIEYGLIALLIAMVIVAALPAIGTNLGDLFMAVNAGFGS